MYAAGAPAQTPSAPAVAVQAPGDGTLPREAEGMDYLLEFDQAREVIECAETGAVVVSPARPSARRDHLLRAPRRLHAGLSKSAMWA